MNIHNIYTSYRFGLNHLFYLAIGLLILVSCVDDSTVEINEPSTSLLGVLGGDIEILENETATISVNFVEQAASSGVVNINFSGNATYGVDFTTVPEGSVDGLSINVPVGAEELSVQVVPIIKLGSVEEDKTINLLFDATGGVSFGPNNSVTVTILNIPEILVTSNLSAFGNTLELTNSTSQNFSVSAIGLTGGLEITAPESFEISLDDSDFGEMIALDAADINAEDTLIYVRFAPVFDAISSVSSNILLQSENATEVQVSVSGTGEPQPPTIIIDENGLTFGGVPTNRSSDALSVLVSGYRLTENISAATSDPFELSLDDETYSSSVSIDFESINDSVEIELFVRFSPVSGVSGDKNGDVTLSSTGATNQQINLSGSEQDLIAFTSFEEPAGVDEDYVDLGDPDVDRVLANNVGQSPVQYTSIGGELGFSTVYISNGGVGLTDGDEVGVTNKTSIVGDSQEAGYTEGVQGYSMDDTDGIVRLVLDPVDVSTLSTLRVSLDYLLNDTDWEADDTISVLIETGVGFESTLFSINGDDIESLGLDPEPHVWNQVDVDISEYVGDTVSLIIQVNTESPAEEVYFDNIRFFGS